MSRKTAESALWNIGFVLSFGALGWLVPHFNSMALGLLKHYGLIQGSFRDNVFIAAITEPWTSKLFGIAFFVLAGFAAVVALFVAILIVMLTAILQMNGPGALALLVGIPLFTLVLARHHLNPKFRSIDYLTKRWLAPLAGLISGLQELYYRMLSEFAWLFWENPNFHPNMLGPVLLHIITGTIIAAAFLTSVSPNSRRTGLFTLGAIVVASGIHFVWNTWLISAPMARQFWTAFYFVGSDVMYLIIGIGAGILVVYLLRDALTALMYLSDS